MYATEEFAAPILRDLREFSPMLLEAGLAEGSAAGGGTRQGPLGVLLSHVDSFAGLVPRLIAEFEEKQGGAGVKVVSVPVVSVS